MSERHRILLVEDDPVNCILMQKLLAFDFDTDMVRTPDKALSKAESNQYDAFLLDINLGQTNMDGVTLMKELQAVTPGSKFIALTSYALPGDREKFLGEGFDGYLSKPVIREQVNRELETLLGAQSEPGISSAS